MILGLDTATHRCGWAAMEEGRLLNCGVWKLGRGDLKERLSRLWDRLGEAGREWGPELVALEVPFVHPRTRLDTAISLGMACGIVLAWAIANGVPTLEVRPTEAKRTLTGSGRATKSEIIQSVRVQFGVAVEEDAADAVAVALAALEHVSMSAYIPGTWHYAERGDDGSDQA